MWLTSKIILFWSKSIAHKSRKKKDESSSIDEDDADDKLEQRKKNRAHSENASLTDALSVVERVDGHLLEQAESFERAVSSFVFILVFLICI